MHPSVVTKALSAAVPGELIRAEFAGHPLLALVTENEQLSRDNGKLLVFLEWKHKKGSAPIWVLNPYVSRMIQSYGTGFEFILDPGMDAADLGQHVAPRSGTIEIRDDDAHLVVDPPPDSWSSPMVFYNLASGRSFFAASIDLRKTYIKKWCLKLSAYSLPHPLAKPLVSFDLSTVGQEGN